MKHCGGRMSNPPHDFENSRLQGYNNKRDGAIVRQWEATGCRPISQHWLGAKNVSYLDGKIQIPSEPNFYAEIFMINTFKPGVYR